MRFSAGDRIAAVGLLVLAALVVLEARTFTVGFLADPLGPRAAPYLVAGFLAASGMSIYVRPGPNPAWPPAAVWCRLSMSVAALGVYAVLIDPIGFMPATVAVVSVLSLIFGGRLKHSLAAAVLFSGALYLLFVYLLGIPLPVGDLFTVSG